MKKKELLKQLIAGFQAGLPVEVYPRELMLPVDSNKIITVPGVRRCGKSSLFLLVINQLISEKGIRKEQILFLNFDDERLQFDAENLDEILQAYRELYPDISLKDVYMFFDEIQMAEDWQPFVRRVYEQSVDTSLLQAVIQICFRRNLPLPCGDVHCSTKSFLFHFGSIVHL
ncbi:MAG: ATP-binding protein [Bacteroides cellulosilyticus]